MPFFIKGKNKKQPAVNGERSSYSKGLGKRKKPGNKSKNKVDDDEIDSDLEDDLTLENNYKYSSESEIEETVQEKRLRLAQTYLKEIEKEEKRKLETEEVDKDVIAQRLKEEVLEKAGKLRKNVADTYSHCGEHIVLKCKEHSRTITCFMVSSDNEHLYSASDDFNVVKWSLKDHKKLLTIKRTDTNGHKRKILALAISSDNKFLASGGLEAKLRIWNPEDMSLIHCFTGHKIDISGLVFRKDTHQLFSCSSDKTVKIWNLDEMTYVETLYGHMSGITSIDALAKDRAVTSGGRDNTLRIWKVPEESHLILNGHKESIDCVKLLNEENCVSGGDSGKVCLWSSVRKKPVFTLSEAHGVDPVSNTPNWILSIATYLHTDLFASGSFNGVINFYKCTEKLKSFEKFMETRLEGNINSMSFTNNGQYLIAGVGQEHRIGRWHTKKKGKNAVQASKKLTDVYGEGVLTVRRCQNWFANFRSGNFDVEDAPRSGRPVEADKDAIKALVDVTARKMAKGVGSEWSIYNLMKYLFIIRKLSFMFPKKKRNDFPNNPIYSSRR